MFTYWSKCKSLERAKLWAVVCLLLACSAGAQVPAVVIGLVEDPAGAVVPHARVRLLSAQGEVEAEQFTDAEGRFHFERVPEAARTIEVAEQGFRDAAQPLKPGKGPMTIRLQIQMESVTVNVGEAGSSSRVSTDVALNQNATGLSRNALDRLPVFDADYITTLSRFLDQDALATSGVTLVVNGVEANGPGVTASAVSGVKVNQNPYSVLFSRPGRARIELETESGTPVFHGSLNYLERDAIFDAQPAYANSKPPERRDYVEGSLTGPLALGKRTTFLASGQYDDDETEAVVLAAVPAGTVSENVPNPVHHVFVSDRLFHDYREANQLWAGYSYEREADKNLGVGGTTLPEAGRDELYYEHEVNVQDRYVFSPKLVNLGHFLVGHNLDRVRSTMVAPQVTVPGSFTAGGAQADALRTESHFDGTDVVTYSSGEQVLTFGIDIPDISRRGNDDFTERQGTYSFDSLSSYAASAPFEYTVQTGPGHVAFVEKVLSGFLSDNLRPSPRVSLEFGARYYFQNYFNDVGRDLAPRFSFAFAPSASGSTVIRGGAGVFFDRTGSRPIADLLHDNGVNIARYILMDPHYPATEEQIGETPTSMATLDARARIPYTLQFGLGIERQVTAKSSAAITYTGLRGIDLFRSINTNAPRAPLFTTVPDAGLGQVRQIQSEGYLKGNSLEVSFQGEPTPYFTGQVQYRLSKTYNNTSGIGYFPADSYNPQADWARSDSDVRHTFNLLGTVHARSWFDLGLALLSRSGLPVDVTTGNDDNNDGVINDRPAGVARNTLHGPAYLDLDLNVSRDVRLSRRKDGPVATASWSSFNVINHRNDAGYVGVITSPFFGTADAAQLSRRMQLSLQVKF